MPGGTEIVLTASNQDIAAQIGTVRELVSRNLSRFQSEGLLSLDGRTVLIPSLDRLEQEIGEP
jgi:CRP/FNR family transcriptional regulator